MNARKNNFLVLFILYAVLSVSAVFGDENQQLTIETGLAPYQVVQSGPNDKAIIECIGTAAEDIQGELEARIVATDRSHKKIVKKWASVGSVYNQRWALCISDIPVGGPYVLELRVKEGRKKTKVLFQLSPFFVGDIWVLAGQSNMHGAANMANVEPPNEKVMLYGMDNTWSVACEPLHRLWESSYPCYQPGGTPRPAPPIGEDGKPIIYKWAGIGLPFAAELVRQTGRPIGLLPCAVGGTSMVQWSPDLKDTGAESLYWAMLDRFVAVGGNVRGVLWYQGESDAFDQTAVDVFAEKFSDFVDSVRKDFGNPKLPFYYVQIGRFVTQQELDPLWNRIQQIQLDMESQIPYSGMVASIDVELNDFIHVGTQGQKTLAKRLSKLVLRDVYNGRKIYTGPRPVKAVWKNTPYGAQIRVSFTGVNEKLCCKGRVSGFSICDETGKPLSVVYNQELDSQEPNTVVLWVTTMPARQLVVPKSATVWYGLGRNPFCTVTDAENMALPAFGGLPIEWPQ